jgi:hypothetical protein
MATTAQPAMTRSSYRLLPTIERLCEVLDYDPRTGIFKWKKSTANRVEPGDNAGTVHSAGYVIIQLDSILYKAHRLAWLMATEKDPGEMEIDHINGNRADNQIANLRLANCSQQSHNSAIRADNSSGVRGVSWNRKSCKWMAYINKHGIHYHLGYFDTFGEAKAARIAAEIRLHGKFSAHLSRGKQ